MLKKNNKNLSIKKPRAILFDTDNTLYEYEPANKEAIEACYLKANNLLGLSRNVFYKSYKKARAEIKKDLGNTASSHSRLFYFQRMIELLDLKTELLIALDLEQTFWRTFLTNANLFPHTLDLINLLKSKKIPIAIVTDLTAHIQLRKLTYFGLHDIFDAVVTSEEAGIDKPDPSIFNLTLRKLKINSYDNVWMVGDNPIADIWGAKNLGAITFQKLHKGVISGKDAELPDFTFTSFKDLYKLCMNS